MVHQKNQGARLVQVLFLAMQECMHIIIPCQKSYCHIDNVCKAFIVELIIKLSVVVLYHRWHAVINRLTTKFNTEFQIRKRHSRSMDHVPLPLSRYLEFSWLQLKNQFTPYETDFAQKSQGF